MTTHISNYDLRLEGHSTGPKQDLSPDAVSHRYDETLLECVSPAQRAGEPH